jgi:hypothetical protein
MHLVYPTSIYKWDIHNLYNYTRPIVAGRQGDCYILPILEGSASIARDCKRDIYSRFLHINIHTFTQQFILVYQLLLHITCILVIDYFYI